MKTNKSKNHGKAKGIVISYVYFVANTILSIAVSAFIVRTVGKTDYGVYQSITAFITFLVLFEFGMSTVMTRNLSLISKDPENSSEIDKNVSTIWSTTIILSIIILIFLVIFYFLIPLIYSGSFTGEQISLAKNIFIFTGINLVVTFLCSTLNGLILAYEEYTFEKYINLAKLIIRSILIVTLLLIDANILIVAIVDMALGILVLLFTIIYSVHKFKAKLTFKYFDKTIFKLALPLALAMLIQGVVNTANTVVDKFLISIMMTPEDVSVYSITMLIFSMYSSIGTLPNRLFLPSIAKDVKAGLEGKEFTKTLVEPVRLNVLIMGIVGFGYFLVGKQFISLVYGPDYVDAWTYSLILLLPLFIFLTDAIMAHVLTIYNKRQVMSYISLAATLINIGLTVIGIKFFGMVGAAVATAISIIIQIISLNIYYSKKLKISVFYLFKEAFKGTIPTLLISFAVSLPLVFLLPNDYLKFFVSGAVFLILFLLLFAFFGANQWEKAKINSLLVKLHLKKKTTKEENNQ